MKKRVTIVAAVVVLLLGWLLAREYYALVYGRVIFSGDFAGTKFRGVIRQHSKSFLTPDDGYYYTLQVTWRGKVQTSFWVNKDSFRAQSCSVQTVGEELVFKLTGYTYHCRLEYDYAVWRESNRYPPPITEGR